MGCSGIVALPTPHCLMVASHFNPASLVTTPMLDGGEAVGSFDERRRSPKIAKVAWCDPAHQAYQRGRDEVRLGVVSRENLVKIGRSL